MLDKLATTFGIAEGYPIVYFEWLVDVEFVNSVMERYSLVQNCNFDLENNMAAGYIPWHKLQFLD